MERSLRVKKDGTRILVDINAARMTLGGRSMIVGFYRDMTASEQESRALAASEMRYRRLTFTETNHIYVDYTYAAAWKLPGVKTDEWHHKVADNRLDLVRDRESFRIVSGM